MAKRSSKKMPGNPSGARSSSAPSDTADTPSPRPRGTSGARSRSTPPKGRPTTTRGRSSASGTRRGRGRTFWVGALAVAVLAVVGVAAFSGSGGGSGVTEPTRFDLPALHGEDRVRLADFEGTPVVVNFFASWCTACDEELPGFARVSEELRGQVQFVGVNALETGDRDLMPDRHGITWWPLARDIGGAQGSGLHDALGGGSSMPLTAFYDASGKLVAVQRAAIPEETLRQSIGELYGISV